MTPIDYEAYEDDWEEDDGHLHSRRRSKLSTEAQRRISDHDVGQIVAVDRGRVTLWWNDELTDAHFGGSMRGQKVVVGDLVRVKAPRHESDVPRVTERLEQSSFLLRTGDDAVDDERVLVANVEQIVVVLAADYLEVGTRFLDRVMVSASIGNLDTVLCVNKSDLGDRVEVGEVVDRYRAIGVPAAVTSAKTGEGLDVLSALLTGSWSAFAGHSGVGKTSLFNCLAPDQDREVGDLGRYGGRHTTVAAVAVRVDSLDAWLVDTPGVRSFGLGNLDAEHLSSHFPELATLGCALDDCLHDGEPGCRIGQAEIHPLRLESYRRLLEAVRTG